jgi:hypothetical protein
VSCLSFCIALQIDFRPFLSDDNWVLGSVSIETGRARVTACSMSSPPAGATDVRAEEDKLALSVSEADANY